MTAWVAGGSDQVCVRHGGGRPPPGWGTLAGGGTQRRAASGVNAGGAFLIVILGSGGARSSGRGADGSPGTGAEILPGESGRDATVEVDPHRVGSVRTSYSPRTDGAPDPGEIVWTWVPFEENDGRGKDRPVLVVAVESPGTYLAVELTSRDHDGEGDFVSIGAGGWDGEAGRPG